MPTETQKAAVGSIIADAQRHSLRSCAAHAAEILLAQRPIGTFIYANLSVAQVAFFLAKSVR